MYNAQNFNLRGDMWVTTLKITFLTPEKTSKSITYIIIQFWGSSVKFVSSTIIVDWRVPHWCTMVMVGQACRQNVLFSLWDSNYKLVTYFVFMAV
jgi:hypothetical protein